VTKSALHKTEFGTEGGSGTKDSTVTETGTDIRTMAMPQQVQGVGEGNQP